MLHTGRFGVQGRRVAESGNNESIPANWEQSVGRRSSESWGSAWKDHQRERVPDWQDTRDGERSSHL